MTKTSDERSAESFKLSEHPHMKIGDAQKLYRQFGEDLQEFYVGVYRTLIAQQKPAELPNSNYLHALQLTSLMLRNTTKHFRLLGGSTTDGFISILVADFRTMLTRLRTLGGSAKIVVLNADVRETLTALAAEFSDTLSVVFAHAKQEEKVGHFIVADEMVRIEEPHLRLTPDTLANTVKARVIFNGHAQAAQYAEQFDILWGMLTARAPAKQ